MAQSLRKSRNASKVPTCRHWMACRRSWCPLVSSWSALTESSLSCTCCTDGYKEPAKYREWNFRACAQVPSRTIRSYVLLVGVGESLGLQFWSCTILSNVLAVSSGKRTSEVRVGSSSESSMRCMLAWCSGPMPPTTSSLFEGKAARISFAVSTLRPISLWWHTTYIFERLFASFSATTHLQSPHMQCFRCIQHRGQSLFLRREDNRLCVFMATPKSSRSWRGRFSMLTLVGSSWLSKTFPIVVST